MRFRILILALVALLFGAEAFAADGFYLGSMDCTGTASTVGRLDSGQHATWCPVSTTTHVVNIKSIADCNWNGDTTGTGAGSVTLSLNQCSGSSTAANDCKTPLVDGDGNPWVVTSNADTGRFSLASGIYLITASSTAANGRLLCSGR